MCMPWQMSWCLVWMFLVINGRAYYGKPCMGCVPHIVFLSTLRTFPLTASETVVTRVGEDNSVIPMVRQVAKLLYTMDVETLLFVNGRRAGLVLKRPWWTSAAYSWYFCRKYDWQWYDSWLLLWFFGIRLPLLSTKHNADIC